MCIFYSVCKSMKFFANDLTMCDWEKNSGLSHDRPLPTMLIPYVKVIQLVF